MLFFSHHMIIYMMIFILLWFHCYCCLFCAQPNQLFSSKAKSFSKYIPNTDRVILFVGFRNLKMMVSKRNLLFQGLLFRFHVKFQEDVWTCNVLRTMYEIVLVCFSVLELCQYVYLRCESEEAIATCIDRYLRFPVCMFFWLIWYVT